MPQPSDHLDTDSLLDTIEGLALEMARLCPDCADKASRLVELAGQLRTAALDRGAIQDAIGTEVVESDVSDGEIRRTTEAVLKVAREGR